MRAREGCWRSDRRTVAGHCYRRFLDAELAMDRGRRQRYGQLLLSSGERIGARGPCWGHFQACWIAVGTEHCARPGAAQCIEAGTGTAGSNPGEHTAAVHRRPAVAGASYLTEVVDPLAEERQAGEMSRGS